MAPWPSQPGLWRCSSTSDVRLGCRARSSGEVPCAVHEPTKAKQFESPVQHVGDPIEYLTSLQNRRVTTFVFRNRLNMRNSSAISNYRRLAGLTNPRLRGPYRSLVSFGPAG